MQEKESIMALWCELKIPSLEITVWHHSVSLVMQNSYPHDGIFHPHLPTIKDSYTLTFVSSPNVLLLDCLNNWIVTSSNSENEIKHHLSQLMGLWYLSHR